ncbi:MAG TPA: hypothetical protein DCP02_07565 [Actinobacteria bacterium]|nr:hypothetical protein [Actinomycetota bacterium]
MERYQVKVINRANRIVLAIFIIITFASLTALTAGCDNEGSGKENEIEDQYISTRVEKKELSEKIALNGFVTSKNSITKKLEIDGTITFIAKKGDTVKKDDALIKLDKQSVEEKLRELELKTKEALIEHEHTLSLKHFVYAAADLKQKEAKVKYEESTGSRLDYIEFQKEIINIEKEKETADYITKIAENKLESSMNEFNNKKDSLSKIEIYSPFDCLIISNYLVEGDNGTEMQKALDFIDINSIVLKLDIPESNKMKIDKGTDVNIELNSYPNKTFKGRVSNISTIPKRTDAGIFYEAFIDFNDVSEINLVSVYGTKAKIVIVSGEEASVLVAPNDYIYKEDDKAWVYKKTDEGITRVFVEIGTSNLNYTEITSGVEEGDEIVINNS